MSTKKGRYGNPAKRRPVVGDLQRMVQPTGNTNPRRLGGAIVGPGGPHDQGSVLLDTTDCVLLKDMEVCTVDTARLGVSQGQAIYMTMAGRINKTSDQVQVGFLFDSDGAAAIITELLALAVRFGPEMLSNMVDRLVKLNNDRNSSSMWLRAALDLAEEANQEV